MNFVWINNNLFRLFFFTISLIVGETYNFFVHLVDRWLYKYNNNWTFNDLWLTIMMMMMIMMIMKKKLKVSMFAFIHPQTNKKKKFQQFNDRKLWNPIEKFLDGISYVRQINPNWREKISNFFFCSNNVIVDAFREIKMSFFFC